MSKYLIIIDCQKDFINGPLGTPEAQAMIPRLVEKIKNQKIGTHFVFTQDTHNNNYMDTFEGKNLPVPHCINDTDGWKIDERLIDLFIEKPLSIRKPTFGSRDLMVWLLDHVANGDEVEFVGLCTDICVISNVLMAKSCFYDKVTISCDATCCAGATPEKHAAALEVMKSCQIVVKE